MEKIKDRIFKCVRCIITVVTYGLYVRADRNFICGWLYALDRSVLRLIGIFPYRITDHRNYTSVHPTSCRNKITGQRNGVTSNVFYEMERADFTPIPMPLPEIYLTKHCGVEIHGESDFVIDTKERVVINDFASNLSPYYENLDGILLKQKGNLAILRFDPARRRKIESGIMLCGKFAFNYFHEVYETLIKLLVVNDIPDIPQNIPLIVDAIVLRIPALNQILNILNVQHREVIYIGRNETICLNNLYHLSHINHIPPQRKNTSEIHPGSIIFDAERVMTMRTALLCVKSEKKFPRRIFLTRRNTKVRRINEEEIIAVLKKYGFELVAPEEYTFPEQVALFNNAEFIIGGTGAAFSNLLFCKAGCKVICLVSRKQSTPVFTTIAYLNGVEMRYLSGRVSHVSKGGQLHADFKIDVCTLERMVNVFMCNGSDLGIQGENFPYRTKRTTVDNERE